MPEAAGRGKRPAGWDNVVYRVLLVLFIVVFLPKGILGSLLDLCRSRAPAALPRPGAGAP